MPAERRVVDNRVLLLGLDLLYCNSVKRHERGELLECARSVAGKLRVPPAQAPVEGYYSEDEQLTEYFLLIRALQDVDGARAPVVNLLPEFQRLLAVTSAPLYGEPQHNGKLLPVGRDALSQSLLDTFPEWRIPVIVAAAHRVALATDEISLVGLAARVQDAVAIAALRESVILYAEVISGAAIGGRPPEYVWSVDEDLAVHATRFVTAFNSLFGEELPAAEPANAERYWEAYANNEIVGRCAQLGHDQSAPTRYYHWAVCRTSTGTLAVHDFWKTEVWTTKLYRSLLGGDGRCPEHRGNH